MIGMNNGQKQAQIQILELKIHKNIYNISIGLLIGLKNIFLIRFLIFYLGFFFYLKTVSYCKYSKYSYRRFLTYSFVLVS